MNHFKPILDPHNTDREGEPLFILAPAGRFFVFVPILARTGAQTDLTRLTYELADARFASDFHPPRT